MPFRLYNTLSKAVEDFSPIDPAGKNVTFYSCGPTVYDFAHIGNFRSFLNADILRRSLELHGYHVHHVMNITDVGHMTDDDVADGGGEDKMAVAGKRLLEAKKSGKLPAGVTIDPSNPYSIADFYAEAFLEDARTLGLKIAEEVKARPELMPRPTKFIPPMIDLVQSLIAKNHAYVAADGVVYFDVRSFPDYGRLSGNTLDSLREGEGGRISAEHQAVKKHPADFMLWKPDASHIMKWPSPWGEGYPGWHLECSAMAAALLAPKGNSSDSIIDLHSGGEDNIFPHHECEIAQSCCASGASRFSRYWFHTRHLIVEGEKMSKSKGNFFTVRDLLLKGATAAAVRLEITRTHYRTNANFTMQGLKDCQRQIDRWTRLHDWLCTAPQKADAATPTSGGPLAKALPDFKAALADDLNVARAIAILSEAASAYDMASPPADATSAAADLAALQNMDSVLAVLSRNTQAAGADDEAAKIDALIASRLEARKSKNWAEGDRIRDELLAMGIAIKDGPTGTTWSRIVK